MMTCNHNEQQCHVTVASGHTNMRQVMDRRTNRPHNRWPA